MENEERYQQAGEHYNHLIWIVFGTGLAFSLYVLYLFLKREFLIESVIWRAFLLFMGYYVLIYSALVLESFGEKKDELFFKAKMKLKFPMKNRLKYFEIFPLSLIISAYLFKYVVIIINFSGNNFYFLLICFFFIIMLFLFGYLLFSWVNGYQFRNELNNSSRKNGQKREI